MDFNSPRGSVGVARRSILLLSTAALALAPRVALANCTTVTGNETAGCTLGSAGQSLTIQNGGTLNGWINMTGSGATATLQSGGTFRYNQSVGANGNTAISIGGPNQTLTNNGTLTNTNNIGADVIGAHGNGFMIVNGATGIIASTNPNAVSNAITDFVANVSGTVINFGTISATGGASEGTIYMPANGGVFTLDNRLGATIRGNVSVAVNIGGTKVTNLRNAGTIATGVAGGTAIALGNGNDTVTLEPTSVITGLVDGRGGTDTLALGGIALNGSFNIGQIGAAAQYRNFETFQKIEAGTWTVTGTAATATSWTALEGTLRLGSSSLGLTSLTAAGGDFAYANGVVITSPVILNALTRLIVEGTDSATQTGVVSGSGAMTKSGTGTLVLTGTNSYSGGTTFLGGVLQVARDANLGAATGGLTFNGGTLRLGAAFDPAATRAVRIDGSGGTVDTNGFNATMASGSTGTGGLTKAGAGTLTLTGNNTYTGGSTIATGTLQLGNGGTSGSIVGDIVNNGALIFNRSGTLALSGRISGTGTVDQNGSGTTVLTGLNSYTGTTTLNAGSLFINGNQGAASGATNVNAGATLGGIGTIGGDVNIASGATLAPGDVGVLPGTLTINQDLTLASGSTLEYSFGQANVAGGPFNDLTTVNGDLVLDGTLNVVASPGGSFDPGVYRVISYDGSLTNNGLTVGTVPTPTFLVQTGVANQVNLVNTNGLALNFWDGDAGPKDNSAVNGGNGVWQNIAGNDNWTDQDGTVNAPFADATFAIFMAAPGAVTVDNSLGAVRANGMQFASDGYVVNGDPLTLAGAPSSTIRVGDGTAAGIGYTARIDVELTGNSQLLKTDLGTLVLSGTNSYSGGTTIRDGMIEIARDANLGAPAGALAFTNNGTLHTTADIATGRSVDFTTGHGTLLTDAATTLMLSGTLTGAGNLTKNGQGTLLLTGTDSHGGSTTVSAGTLMAGGANVLSAASPYTVLGGATIDLGGHDQTIAALGNAGLVRFTALGTTLNVAGDYAGNGGTLQLDTALGTDTSATDLLRVGGNTSGTSTLKVSNTGGRGAQTVEGIKIVDVGGASGGTFSLLGDYVINGEQAVVAGAYGYTLQKNGVSTPGDGDWYLRSELTPTPPGTSPTAPPSGPIYQPGAPLYEAYAQVLQSLNGVSSLQQRVGNRYWAGAGNSALAQGDGPGTVEAAPMPSEGGDTVTDARGIWARIDGAHGKFEPRTSTTDADYDIDTWKLTTGIDGQFYESDAGKLISSLTAHYGHASADITSFFGDGSIDTDGYGLGGTLTWYGQNGFYVDGQAQATWYDSDLTSDTLGTSLTDGNNGFGYAFSLETGKRIDLDQSWTLTPQAQLAYSNVDIDDFTDPFGADVSFGSGDSLKGRVGLSADYQNAWEDGAGKLTRTNLYGLANLYYEFLDGNETDVSGVNFATANDRTWGGIGAGGSYNWNDDKYSLYSEVSINTSLSNFADSYSLNGTAGFRVKF
ncbi:outer membrane autotransporter protein [Phyllobacterium trifolii]|uniref:Outer membrane autotransporter protein n=1 Tax=Phyllobacterium trifolii TaxID=300193 RepID=A0A839UB12_9HYPH|nr:autotransporter outer membrane beta-barrel domain-containing protein [Phyllobacterium trifolii]MBB3146160.1 outer membrane autotransporter protein [Phyllobacterium trifolii]